MGCPLAFERLLFTDSLCIMQKRVDDDLFNLRQKNLLKSFISLLFPISVENSLCNPVRNGFLFYENMPECFWNGYSSFVEGKLSA